MYGYMLKRIFCKKYTNLLPHVAIVEDAYHIRMGVMVTYVLSGM